MSRGVVAPAFFMRHIQSTFERKLKIAMRNTLNFCTGLAILLIVGKVGHIGTLAQLSWLQVLMPLIVDCGYDIYKVFNKQFGWSDRIKTYLLQRRINKIANQIKKDI